MILSYLVLSLPPSLLPGQPRFHVRDTNLENCPVYPMPPKRSDGKTYRLPTMPPGTKVYGRYRDTADGGRIKP
jgi:hypothetical protein